MVQKVFDGVSAQSISTDFTCRLIKELSFSSHCWARLQAWIQYECWFWQCIWARGNLMFAPHRVRFLVWPHFGASTSETGRMSYQPTSDVPSGIFQYLMATILSKREVQQSLDYNTVLPLVALFLGSRAVCLWLLRCLTKLCPHWPGGALVITHSLID